MTQLYDEIGIGYGGYRRPDPRIASAILDALGEPAPVVNVGAGTGSYEPPDRRVVAVEPAAVMIRQRPAGSNPAVQASATHLPFRDSVFSAALAVLTIHHWPDLALGPAELVRVARQRIVILTWDPAYTGFWLVDDYFPAIAQLDREMFPPLDALRHALGPLDVRPLSIPHDCSDGFLGAYWRRPQAYLDVGVRAAISAFALIGDTAEGHLLQQDALDLGLSCGHRAARRCGRQRALKHVFRVVLAVIIAANCIGLATLLSNQEALRRIYAELRTWMLPVLGLLSLASIAACAALWSWRRWGFGALPAHTAVGPLGLLVLAAATWPVRQSFADRQTS